MKFELLINASSGQTVAARSGRALAVCRMATAVTIFISGCAIAGPGEDAGLVLAAERGDLKAVKIMFDLGARVNGADRHGNTALITAAASGDLATVSYLLNRGARVNVSGGNGFTPLGTAVVRGHIAVARVLIRANADVDTKDAAGNPPFMVTIRFGRRNMIELLLGADVDVDARDALGQTALMLAAQSGQRWLVDELLTRRVDINRRDHSDRSALYWSIFEGNDDCALALINAGAEHRLPTNGYRPEHWARVLGRTAVLGRLAAARAAQHETASVQAR